VRNDSVERGSKVFIRHQAYRRRRRAHKSRSEEPGTQDP
jgi:hypothetical protein